MTNRGETNMSSTEGPNAGGPNTDGPIEEKLRRFFQRELTPAAEALRTRGVDLFPLGPDKERETYWEPAPDDEPDFIEVTPENFGAGLEARWNEQGLPELAVLASRLMELAQDLEIQQEQSEELSPFVYVMY
jgi:hypothetical protein